MLLTSFRDQIKAMFALDRPHLVRRPRRRRPRNSRLQAETLERRLLLAGTGLDFDDFADAGEWAVAAEISIDSATARGTIQGALEERRDADLFGFVAARTGEAVIRLDTPASRLDPYLYVFDGTNRHDLVAQNDDSHGLDSQVTIDVIAGETYFVLADNYRDRSAGSYTLSLQIEAPAIDDHADRQNWSLASAISVDPITGAGTANGLLEEHRDTDLFQFVAPATGQAVLRLDTPASRLDPYLYVFDGTSRHGLVARNDDYHGYDSQVTIDVSAGQTYFVLADNYRDRSTGSYALTIHADVAPSDDHPDFGEWGTATPISLDTTTGDGSAQGTLEQSGDSDLFQFIAPETGQAVIRLEATDDVLHPYLEVGDSRREDGFLASDGDVDRHDAQVTIDVTAGETYFVLASGAPSELTGAYAVSVHAPVRDHADFGEWDAATAILLDATTGAGSARGVLEQSGDSDLFQFVAPETGQVVIRLEATDDVLHPCLSVGDSRREDGFLAGDGNFDGRDAQVTIDVTAGETYFVMASGAPSELTGAYSLAITCLTGE